MSGAHTRRYHGLLVAALDPPLRRTVLVSKLEETLVVDGERIELGCNRYPGAVHPAGYRFLETFRRDLFPELSSERRRGLDFCEDLWTPGEMTVRLEPGDRLGVLVTIETVDDRDPLELLSSERRRREGLLDRIPGATGLVRTLALLVEAGEALLLLGKFGEAALALARCHDESGQRDPAEAQLRSILERHNFIEARVRLARIHLARGERAEAQRQIDQVREDAASLPRKLMSQQRPWIRAARRLRSGDSRLPKPGRPRRGGGARVWVIAAAGAAALVPLTMVAWALISAIIYASWGEDVMETHARSEELAGRLLELDERFPPAEPDRPEVAELSPDDVAAYVRVRRALAPHVAAFTDARQAMREVSHAVRDGGRSPHRRRRGRR